MARIRTIKPDFWTDEKVVELSAFARLLFIGLWNFADDEGRMECSPKRIKMQILPADSAEVPRLLEEIRAIGLIDIYTVDGIDYLQVQGFAKHQKIDKRSPSKHPKKPVDGSKPAEFRRVPPTEGKGSGMEGKESTPAVITKTTAASDPPAGVVPADAGQSETQPPPPAHVVAAVDALRAGLAVGTDEHDRAGDLWAVMAANGVRGTASHPTVVEMVRDGVTQQELRAAIIEARKSTDTQLSPPYLAAIVARMRSGKGKANGKSAAWVTDDKALEAKAQELGMWPTRAASYHELRNLVRDRIAKHAEESVR